MANDIAYARLVTPSGVSGSGNGGQVTVTYFILDDTNTFTNGGTSVGTINYGDTPEAIRDSAAAAIRVSQSDPSLYVHFIKD